MSEYIHNADVLTLDGLRDAGYARMQDIASANRDATIDELHEAEGINRQFSPNEHWIAALNSRSDSNEAWDALDEGIADAAAALGLDEDMVLTRADAEAMHDEAFDAAHGPVRIGGLEYQPSRVLREVDSVAYRESVYDYIDSLESDGYRVDD